MFTCKQTISVISLGVSFGRRYLTNTDLITQFELAITAADLANKTGINSRYFLAEDQSLSAIATEAAANALACARMEVNDLSRIILATSTPDYLTPSTACLVQHQLGGRGFPCHDISAACSGFIFALDQALRYLHTGDETVLIIGADARSRTLSTADVNTFGLYGDGAGAMILGKSTGMDDNRVIASFTYADGSGYDAVTVPAVGLSTREQRVPGILTMPSGNRVMKNAIKAMPLICNRILEHTGLSLHEIDHFVFHQPNLMLLRAIAERMGIPADKVETSYPRAGNTVAGSIPITLHSAWQAGRLKPGDDVLLAAIGAGFTSGAALLRWGLANE